VEDSFKSAYLRTEFDFFEQSPAEETSGTTAVTILIENSSGRYWCANAGDSRAILSRAGEVVPLSNDHRVTNPSEVDRIHRAGGFIKNKRAMGRLECFRTIGDADVDSKVVTAEPEIISGTFCEDDEFIVMGCDGLYDVLTNEQIIEYVRERRGDGLPAKEISQRLAEYTVNECNSRDNVTVILVQLNSGTVALGNTGSGEATVLSPRDPEDNKLEEKQQTRGRKKSEADGSIAPRGSGNPERPASETSEPPTAPEE